MNREDLIVIVVLAVAVLIAAADLAWLGGGGEIHPAALSPDRLASDYRPAP